MIMASSSAAGMSAGDGLGLGPDGGLGGGEEIIDMSSLVTALESLLTLAAKQHIQGVELRRHLQSPDGGDDGHSPAAGCQQGAGTLAAGAGTGVNVPYIDGVKTEAEQELEKEVTETEAHIRRKLIEIHSRLKNGCVPWDEDEDLGLNEDSGANPADKLALKNKVGGLNHADGGGGGNGGPAGGHALLPDQRPGNDDDDDEGTVSDPSPSPQIPKYSGRKASAVIGPAKESAVAIIRQCLTVFDPERDFTEESKALSAQLLAELAKSDVGRSLCLHQSVELPRPSSSSEAASDLRLTFVIKSVAQVLSPSSPLETTVQVCRILANLCYNCDDGRRQILENRSCLEMLVEIARGREYRAKTCGEDPGQRLPAILPGFLLNFCNGTPDAVKAIGQLGFIGVICETVVSTKTNDAVFNNCLLFMNCLIDEPESHEFFGAEAPAVTSALCHVIEHSTSPEVTESALELMQGMTNSSEQLVLALAQNPQLCSLIMSRIEERWKSPDYEDHRKTACNLLVLILSDDESMKMLFADKESAHCEKFRDWLEFGDEDMQICACLCIGNFACSESNSMALVANGCTSGVIKLLGASQGSSGVRLACLGAIKNFVIGAPSRKAVLDQGLLEPCLKLARSLEATPGGVHAYSCILKLVATLRLCASGNPDLVQRLIGGGGGCDAGAGAGAGRAVVTKVIQWSTGNESPSQVKDECTRFIAVILKYCHEKQVIRQVIECGGLPQVVLMLHSRHPVMANEAVTSLTLMASVMLEASPPDQESGFDFPGQVSSQLHTDAVVNGVKNVLTNAKTPPEIKSNCAVFLQTLLRVNRDQFKAMLAEMNFKAECLSEEALRGLPQECAELAAQLN